MSDFLPLAVAKIQRETEDAVKISFHIPDGQIDKWQYEPGQYLTFKKIIDGEELRRSYSICSATYEKELSVAVKQIPDGRFSTYANTNLVAGDVLETMPPAGLFTIKDKKAHNYLFIAAGSGITPIMSMLKTLLSQNTEANVTLMYGNKMTSSIIFQEELEDIKDQYMQRFSLVHVLSQEIGENEFNNGRISAEKCQMLFDKSIPKESLEGIYMCGPSQMIMDLKDHFIQNEKIPSDKVHFELFNTDNLDSDSEYKQKMEANKELSEKQSKVTIEVDGRKYALDLTYGGETILDAALKTGADLPFACKGGVCCTCRAKVLKGEVDMEKNYALEPDEVANGFILTCQSHPKTAEVEISFDFK